LRNAQLGSELHVENGLPWVETMMISNCGIRIANYECKEIEEEISIINISNILQYLGLSRGFEPRSCNHEEHEAHEETTTKITIITKEMQTRIAP